MIELEAVAKERIPFCMLYNLLWQTHQANWTHVHLPISHQYQINRLKIPTLKLSKKINLNWSKIIQVMPISAQLWETAVISKSCAISRIGHGSFYYFVSFFIIIYYWKILIIVSIFGNGRYRQGGGGKFLPEDIDPKLCTHIVYGWVVHFKKHKKSKFCVYIFFFNCFAFRFAVIDRDLLTIKPHDTWADFDNHFYDRVVAFKKKGVKVTVAIGGWVKIYLMRVIMCQHCLS